MPHLVGARRAQEAMPKSKGLVTAHELMAFRAGAWLLTAML